MKACIQVCPKNPVNFNVDNVRVAKLLGGGVHDSTVVRGLVLKSDAVGTIKRMEKAKVRIWVFICLLLHNYLYIFYFRDCHKLILMLFLHPKTWFVYTF